MIPYLGHVCLESLGMNSHDLRPAPFPIYSADPSINEVISKNSEQNTFDLINK